MALSAIIILAAGKSRRMKTKTSKVLHCLLGKPMLFYGLELAEKLKPKKVVVVVGPNSQDIRDALQRKKVAFATQKQPRGTADAVRAALPELKGHKGEALIFYADNPLFSFKTLKSLVRARQKSNLKLAFLTAQFPKPPAFGRILRDSQGRVLAIKEQADCTEDQKKIKEVNAGVYCVDIDFLKTALAEIKSDNRQKEYYLTDIVQIAVNKKLPLSTSTTQDWRETLGINSRAELVQAESMLKARINAGWMARGVTIEDPERTIISPDAKIGQDTIIESGARVLGKSRIGKNCRVQAQSRVLDSVIEDNVEIRQGSVIEDSRVKAGATVGPMAHLRPGSVAGKNVRIGNFVELKKAELGDRSMAAHLTYLGDAVIGKDVNIGCGVITCNYDGKNKNRTYIEDNAFIGSDTQLIAPVRVGKRAYIGSGSTITENVPPDSLAIARATQVIKPQWLKKKKK